MSLDVMLTFGVLLATIVLFVSEKLSVDVVAMLALAALLVLGLVSPQQALSGFASEATITVAAMFVLSHALSRSGALRSRTGTAGAVVGEGAGSAAGAVAAPEAGAAVGASRPRRVSTTVVSR